MVNSVLWFTFTLWRGVQLEMCMHTECTKWSTAETNVVEHVSAFPNCVNAAVDNSNVMYCAEVLDLKCGCTQSVIVGRGCFELWHGGCSVCVNVSLTGGRTVQPCVHTQIRHPAHNTLQTNWTHCGHLDTVNCCGVWRPIYTWDITCQCPTSIFHAVYNL